MSMMYPNGQGAPSASQFMVGQQPNYAAGLVNFQQGLQPVNQALNPQQQKPQQPGQPTQLTPGPGQGQPGGQQDFAAKLRAFFSPGGQGQPAGVGFGGPAMAQSPQQPQQSMLPSSGASFNQNGLY